ncbi:MAG: hypothetical protein Q9184_005178, partial [Pyrenodesmia sp. 2 TL-2023]
METPFNRGSFTTYSGMMQCIFDTIWDFNQAHDGTSGTSTDCSICHGSMGFAEGGASIKLAMTVLSYCKHRFHESCLMQWLTPIQLPSTSQEYDAASHEDALFPAASGDDRSQIIRADVLDYATIAQDRLDTLQNDPRNPANTPEDGGKKDPHVVWKTRVARYIQTNRRLVEMLINAHEGMTSRQLQERFRVIVASSDEMVEGDANNLETHRIRENEASTSNPDGHTVPHDPIERTGDGRQEELQDIDEAREHPREAQTAVEESLDGTLDEPQDVEGAHLGDSTLSDIDVGYSALDLAIFPCFTSRENPSRRRSARWLRWQAENGEMEDHGQTPQLVAQHEQPVVPRTAPRPPAVLGVLIKARSSKCPLCRRPAFDNAFQCHGDAIQLIRLRLRLSDFAYAITSLSRSEHEGLERAAINKFLERRYNDNVALGEQEELPSIRSCRDLFAYARWELQGQVCDYLNSLESDLSKAEKKRVGRLGAVFDNYILRAAHIP